MDDLISRKAAIEAISCNIIITGRQNAELVAATIGAFADRIKALPSAQPEIIRCKDCKRWKGPRDYECPYHTSGDPYIDDDPEEDFFCKLGERREDDG